MNARAILFGDDFRGPPPEVASARAETREAEHAEAERRGYARGVEEGRRAAAAETERLLAQAVQRLADALPAAAIGLAERLADQEADALTLFGSLARKLAGKAVDEQPLAAIGEAAIQSFRHLRGVPHLAVRVAPDLVDGTDQLLKRLAREHGFEGRVVVLGDDETPPGDARLEWADGGVVLDRRRLDAAAADLLSRIGREHPDATATPA